MTDPKDNVAKSRFAQALEDALDQTHVFESRKDWAIALSVTPGAISQWVNDKTIPRPTTLRSLLDVLRTRVAEEHDAPVAELERLLSLPAEEVSPSHVRAIGRSLQDYVIAPALHGLLVRFKASLRTLAPRRQEQLIQDIAAALPQLIDPKHAQYLRLVEQYRPGTQINETDLPDILSTRLWKHVYVISRSPYELLTNPRDSGDHTSDLILNIYQASLKYLVNKCSAEVSYVVTRKENVIDELNHIVNEVFGTDPNPLGAHDLINARLVEPGNFERARLCAARRFRDGGEAKPAAIILFNPGLNNVFGYSWFEDTAGCILDAQTIGQVLDALSVRHLEQNVIRLNPRKPPKLRSMGRSAGRAGGRGPHAN